MKTLMLKKSVHLFFLLLLTYPLLPRRITATEGILYVVESDASEIYAVNPMTGKYSTLGTFPPAVAGEYNGLGLENGILYSPRFGKGGVVAMNQFNGASYIATTNPDTPLADIAVVNSTTAYVLSNDYNIYSVNLQNGQSSLITSSPIVASAPGDEIGTMALTKDHMAAYVTAFNNTIYSVNLLNGSHAPVTSVPLMTGTLEGITLASDTLAYVVGSDNNVYLVDLTTGGSQLITPTPIAGDPSLYFIILDPTSNGATGYTGGFHNGQVYQVDLQTGTYLPLLSPPPNPTSSSAQGLAFFPFIQTARLHGNDRKLATYLNNNGSFATISLFNQLKGGTLEKALQAAAPTRNAFATFASQNGYLASSQVFTDHMRQKRIPRSTNGNENTARNDLLADASDETCSNMSPRRQNPCTNRGYFSGWLSGFGEYAHEKEQHQSPAFSASGLSQKFLTLGPTRKLPRLSCRRGGLYCLDTTPSPTISIPGLWRGPSVRNFWERPLV
jgi:hypothetical protein